MKKTLSKIIISFFCIYLLQGTSVNITEAFLDSDLGLNLYKELDEWLEDFEEKMYVYELNWQDKQDITENINKILLEQDIWNCLINGISPSIVELLVEWNVKTVTENMTEECYNSKEKKYNNEKIWTLIGELWNIKEHYLKKSEEKTNTIHEISRIWMYSDWNIKNSPFDLIKDLNDINSIIFTEDIEYDDENLDFLKKYQDKALIWSNKSWNKWWLNKINNKWWHNININNISWKNKKNSTNTWNNIKNTVFWKSATKQNISKELDWHNFLCASNKNYSWLNKDSLNNLLGSINNDKWLWKIFNYWTWWHIKLPDSNKISIPPSLNSPDFISQSLKLWISPYKKINDNDVWKCNEFFCIIIDFVIKKQKLLDYSVSHSVQNIIEVSNKHLKKAANTSLVQSKMTTNNFEISLRDLDLPNMFHMWINLSYKSPPILEIEKTNINQHEKNKEEVKNMLIEKYKNLWLDYNKSNNLNIFKKNLKKIKTITFSTENPNTRASELKEEFNNLSEVRKKILNYNKETLHTNITDSILKDFNTQFNEITQFNENIIDYIYNLDIIVKKLREIKTYSW